MAYANIAEINVCLTDCVKYCEQNPGSVHCKRFSARLKRVVANLQVTESTSDRFYASWRREEGLDKRSWKAVSTLLRDVQRELKRIDAIGYPDRRVMYWDEPLLEVAAQEMMAYLRDRSGEISFAADYLARFEQAIRAAHNEDDDSDEALHTYQNHIGARRDAVSDAAQLITEMRSAMRKDLGKDHPDYRSIRWAWALSPDEPVL